MSPQIQLAGYSPWGGKQTRLKTTTTTNKIQSEKDNREEKTNVSIRPLKKNPLTLKWRRNRALTPGQLEKTILSVGPGRCFINVSDTEMMGSYGHIFSLSILI